MFLAGSMTIKKYFKDRFRKNNLEEEDEDIEDGFSSSDDGG